MKRPEDWIELSLYCAKKNLRVSHAPTPENDLELKFFWHWISKNSLRFVSVVEGIFMSFEMRSLIMRVKSFDILEWIWLMGGRRGGWLESHGGWEECGMTVVEDQAGFRMLWVIWSLQNCRKTVENISKSSKN
jgi:hypothetical protein